MEDYKNTDDNEILFRVEDEEVYTWKDCKTGLWYLEGHSKGFKTMDEFYNTLQKHLEGHSSEFKTMAELYNKNKGKNELH